MRLLELCILGTLAFTIVGCQNSQKKVTIYESGPLSWRCILDSKIEVTVKGYVFPSHENTLKVFKELLARNKKRIQRARKWARSAPTEELRKSYEEEIHVYETGFYEGAGAWPGWPIVMMFPVLTERPLYKVIFVCRSKKASADFLFTMISSETLDNTRFVYVAKLITATVHCLTREQLNNLPREKGPLFDSDGNLMWEGPSGFTEDITFIRQR